MRKLFVLIALLISFLFVGMSSRSVIYNTNFDNAIQVIAESEYTKQDFLDEWNAIVRPTDEFDPCGANGITRSQYKTLKEHFALLSENDQEFILNMQDGNTGNTIRQTFATLDVMFSSSSPSSRGDGEISESAALGIILSVSLVGMTTICVFYIFKTKQIID